MRISSPSPGRRAHSEPRLPSPEKAKSIARATEVPSPVKLPVDEDPKKEEKKKKVACAMNPFMGGAPPAASGYPGGLPNPLAVGPQPPLAVAMNTSGGPAPGAAGVPADAAQQQLVPAVNAQASPDAAPVGYENCGQDVDRSVAVYSASARTSFPAPRSYDTVDDTEDDATAMILSRGPWMHRCAVEDHATVNRYIQDWRLPGNLPVEALYTRCWRDSVTANDEELFVSRNRSLGDVRREYSKLVYRHVRRYSPRIIYPLAWDLDNWAARYPSEYHYARRVSEVPESRLREWSGFFGVSNDALLFTQSILPLEFRFLRKRPLRSFSEFARQERKLRSRYGYLIPYQHVEFPLLTHLARERRFVAVNRLWRTLEVPRGCYAELPSVLTLVQGDLWGGDQSGWWTVFVTEWAARVAAYVLWDAYDNCRLWALSATLIGFIRQLDLSQVLGSRANEREMLELLTEI